MKYILYSLLGLLIATSCSDDDKIFGEMPDSNTSINFTPNQGGAVMHYTIPESENIAAINVRYRDELGKEIIVAGSYLSDSLLITGFNKPATNVKAEVFYTDRDDIKSETVEYSFNTGASGAVIFLDKIVVSDSWYGFKINYEGIPNARSIAHVFYKGTNPSTGEAEDILLESFVVSEFDDTRYYTLEKGGDVNDVIIKTEDYYGYRAGEKLYENVASFKSHKIEYGADFDLIDPDNLSYEDTDAKTGISYLFDGDTKGDKNLNVETYIYNTFVTSAGAFSVADTTATTEHKYMVIDLKEETQVASLRFYTMLSVRFFSYYDHAPLLSSLWGDDCYASRLPSHIKIYATNDPTANVKDKAWTYITEYKQSTDITTTNRWCYSAPGTYANSFDDPNRITDIATLDASDPQYLEISFSSSMAKYRYVRFDVIDTYDMYNTRTLDFTEENNIKNYTLNEIEVYVKSN